MTNEINSRALELKKLGWKCANPEEALFMDKYECISLDHENKTYTYVEEKQQRSYYYSDELIEFVELWARERGLLHQSNSNKQMLKVMEEVGETASALAKDDRDGLIDGIGDVMVTLIILAAQNSLSIKWCLASAYEEIKDRTGETKNGVFIKNK